MPEYRNIPINAPCYSEVAQVGDRTLCVTVPEMVLCGISENYLTKRVLPAQRNNEVTCWPHHKDGIIYLHYDGLKPQYQAMIRTHLMQGLSVDKWYANNGRLDAIRNRLEPYADIRVQDEVALDEARYPNGEKLSPAARQKAADACRWLTVFLNLKKKSKIKAIGYNTAKEMYDDMLFLINKMSISLPTNYLRLRAKIREYEEKGAVCCIDNRGKSNKNASKVYTEEQVALLRFLCGLSASYNAQQIANSYNAFAVKKGWDNISRRSVLDYMKEYKLIIEAGRNGSEAFRNKIASQNRRERPSEALTLWSLDGWTVELYYQKDVKDASGKVVHTYTNRKTAVIVIDACCDYPVGYAIGDCESVKLITAAVKNAADYVADTLGAPFRPYQIQSDHYGIKSMSTIYSNLAEYFTPARVKNAKTKPIERYFLHLNKTYCQGIFGNYNWSGFGITAKRESQPNIDVLNYNKTKFPTEEGVINQIHAIIAKERELKHQTWLKAWNRMPDSDRLLMDREKYLLTFGLRNERTIRLNAGCLEPTIMGEKRAYDTLDLSFRMNPLQSWTVMYDERDLSTILVMDETEKERHILTALHKQPMALRDRKPGDFEALKAVDRFNKEVLEPYVLGVVNKDEEKVLRLLEQTPELEGWRAYNMITDSRGQQKAWLQHAALIKSEDDLAAEIDEKLSLNAAKTAIKQQQNSDKKAKKAAEQAYEEYAKSKIDFNKFRNI